MGFRPLWQEEATISMNHPPVCLWPHGFAMQVELMTPCAIEDSYAPAGSLTAMAYLNTVVLR